MLYWFTLISTLFSQDSQALEALCSRAEGWQVPGTENARFCSSELPDCHSPRLCDGLRRERERRISNMAGKILVLLRDKKKSSSCDDRWCQVSLKRLEGDEAVGRLP